jgi:hypothetical protein
MNRVLITFIILLYTSNAWSITEVLQSFAAEKDSLSGISVNRKSMSVLQHLENLSSDQFAGREFASKGGIQSQNYLVSTLEALAIPAFQKQFRHSFDQSGLFQSKQGTNIIAFVPGTHFIEEYIILTAHYDHLGTKRNKVFNGADDNASGTAALLDYGKRLKLQPLKHSVILLFTDGEEVDLLGARAFIDQQKSILDQFKLNINLDMIAGSKRTKRLRFISQDLVDILSTSDLENFNQLQTDLKTSSTAQLTSGFRNTRGAGSSISRTNWRMASDHGVFSKAGIPFLYFGVGPHKNYHTEFDDFNNINRPFFVAATDIIFQQLIFLDNAMANRSIKLN